MRDLVFKISNHHTDSAGQPPANDGDADGAYHGYFTNEHGEQALFAYDHATGEATVRMGDAGWDQVHRVVDSSVAGLNVTEAEATGFGRAGYDGARSRSRARKLTSPPMG